MFKRFYIWQLEALVVFAVLVATVVISGNSWREWIGAAAVLFTFMHAQVSDRMVEQQGKLPEPSVECYRMSHRYFMAKETLWLVYFVLSQTWAALMGVIVFLLYPLWRKIYRTKLNPI